jgi:glycosyltransferase involved in cell wall biosynthesis
MISVVIPLYNKEKSIVSTIESVVAQTYKDWELIIVDDGSTDNSLNVAHSFVNSLTPSFVIKIIHKENGGVSSARNRGVIEANGEYVAFLDGDDIWDKDFLKEMVKLIADYPEKSIYGLGCEQIRRGEMPIIKDNYYRGESAWSYATMAFTGSSACVNKKDAIEVGLFDTRMTHGEDLDMWWRLILLHGGASDKHPYAYYIQDAENRAMHRLAPLQKHIPFYVDKFAEARAKDVKFRRFFDKEMIQRLYPYLLEERYRKEAKQLVKKFDYALQDGSLRWRLKYPYIYRFYQKIAGK